MSKPWIHAESSARRWGGEPEDYIEIHNLMDSSKGTIADSRHRALTHNAWFISEMLERIFGVVIKNSAGRRVSVRDVGEQHVLEDYSNRFIPSAQDFLEGIPMRDWMNNGRQGSPPSFKAIEGSVKKRRRVISLDEPGDLVECSCAHCSILVRTTDFTFPECPQCYSDVDNRCEATNALARR